MGSSCYRATNMGQSIVEQAGVFAVRRKSGIWKMLAVRSRSGKRWVIPKGIVESGFTRETTAVREAFEEGGIKGRLLSEPAGEYTYRKWGDNCRVTVYLFLIEKILKTWPEDRMRKRKWMEFGELEKNIDERIPRRLLSGIPDLMKTRGVENG